MESLNEDGRQGRSTGVLPLLGAVPIVDQQTGKVRMEKVKVQRYIAGQRPNYAEGDSDDEKETNIDVKEVFERVIPEKPKSSKDAKKHESDDDSGEEIIEVKKEEPADDDHEHEIRKQEYNDPRLRRLNQLKQPTRRRRKHSSDDDIKDEEPSSSDYRNVEKEGRQRTDSQSSDSSALSQDVKDDILHRQRIRDDEYDKEKESDEDEEELSKRREIVRLRALQMQKEQDAKLKEEQQKQISSSEEESSDEEDDYTSSEDDMAPRLKPVFVRKRDRVTLHETAKEAQRLEELKLEEKRMAEQRKRDSQKIVENIIKSEIEREERAKKKDQYELESVNTDDESEELAYEEWKVRELQRIKRDKDEREARRAELEEIEKLHNMTDEERRNYFRINPKLVTNKQEHGKMKFMQKYFHRGVFYLDEDNDLFKRDFTSATLEDRFDKTVLPKIMQVRDYGKKSRSKWTHLVAEDTTDFQSNWVASDNANAMKFMQQHGGGMKEQFSRPAAKKRKI